MGCLVSCGLEASAHRQGSALPTVSCFRGRVLAGEWLLTRYEAWVSARAEDSMAVVGTYEGYDLRTAVGIWRDGEVLYDSTWQTTGQGPVRMATGKYSTFNRLMLTASLLAFNVGYVRESARGGKVVGRGWQSDVLASCSNGSVMGLIDDAEAVGL